MISFGKNIIAANDPLQKVPLVKIYHAIKNPKPETQNMLRQLRIMRGLDIKRYKEQKKCLPYIVCAMFNPAFRNRDNFAYTEYFILDFDNLAEKGMDVENIRKTLIKDDRVVMCFVSPSEDGLKVVFRLKERCYDAGVYSLFYKVFSKHFSIQYNLSQVIDVKTSDVSRACFISIDPAVYYNADAAPIDLTNYVNKNDSMEFFAMKSKIAFEEKERKKKESDSSTQPGSKQEDVDQAVIDNIKSILVSANQRKIERPPVYVPEQLDGIIDSLRQHIEQAGLQVTDIINIQYGKKIKTKVGLRLAETNVFYGRKGYSVIISPRTGTNTELNEVVCQLIKSYFETY